MSSLLSRNKVYSSRFTGDKETLLLLMWWFGRSTPESHINTLCTVANVRKKRFKFKTGTKASFIFTFLQQWREPEGALIKDYTTESFKLEHCITACHKLCTMAYNHYRHNHCRNLGYTLFWLCTLDRVLYL